MQGYCPNCMKPMSEGRYCPHCGYDLLQNLPRQGDTAYTVYTAPVEQNRLYTAPVAPQEPEISKPVTGPKRRRKLPIFLAVLVCVAMFLVFGKPEEEAPDVVPVPVEEPAAMPEPTTPRGDLIFYYQEEGLTVTVDQDRLLTVTASGLDLQETYPVNLPESEPNINEYNWRVTLRTETDAMVVLVNHMKEEEGEPKEIRIDQMNGSLLSRDNDWGGMGEGFYNTGVEVELSSEGDSITWKCVVPEKIPVVNKPVTIDLSAFRCFEVGFSDFVNDVDWEKLYDVAQ